METLAPEPVQKGNELKVTISGEPQHQPVAPVTWCVTPQFNEALSEDGYGVPRVLFIIVRDNKEISRQLANFKDGFRNLRFYSSGEHTVHAVLISPMNGMEHDLRMRILKGGDRPGTYKYELIDEADGNLEIEWLEKALDDCGRRVGNFQAVTALTVEIAEEQFAKRPPPRLWRWVNWWYQNEAIDECQYRRRCWFWAFTLQPPVVLLWAVMLIAARIGVSLWLMLTGSWGGFSPSSPILHPFKAKTAHLWQGTRNVFFEKPTGERRHWAFILLSPLSLITTGTYLYLGFILDLWALFALILVGALVVGSVILLLIHFLSPVVERKFTGIRESRETRRVIRERRSRDRQKAALQAAIGRLACDGEPTTPSYGSLPLRQRARIPVAYGAAKRLLCRNYSR